MEEFDELLAGLTNEHSRQGQEGGGGGVGVAVGGASGAYPHHHEGPQFVYHALTGQEMELCPEGRHKTLT